MIYKKLLTNSPLLIPDQKFCGIIGVSPSLGARSPSLWNACFERLGIDAVFHAFDVEKPRLAELINVLRLDPLFLGGAVAVPYKELILDHLDDTDCSARLSGAVNAIYRSADGRLIGANTDGEAAILCLTELWGEIKGKNVLCMGTGGASAAITGGLFEAGAKVSVWGRNHSSTLHFVKKKAEANVMITPIASIQDSLRTIDILVNCTTVGFRPDSQENTDSPITPAEISLLPEYCTVYDIIYQPVITQLVRDVLKTGRQGSNGGTMNLTQAVLAFSLVFPDVDKRIIFKTMSDRLGQLHKKGVPASSVEAGK